MIKVIINNKEAELPQELTVEQLLMQRGVPKAAVWVNGEQMQKSDYSSRVVVSGDEIKILRITSGG